MKKKLTEGTSNFGDNGSFQLYCGITYDELMSRFELDDNIPEPGTDEFYEYEEKWFEENNPYSSWVDESDLDSIKRDINELNDDIDEFAQKCWLEDEETYSDDYYNIRDLHATLEPGYYEGFCIKVENQDSLDYIKDRKLKKELIELIDQCLEQIGNRWHLDNFQVVTRFSNGEVIYQKKNIKESLSKSKKNKSKYKVVEPRVTCGNIEKNIADFNKGTSLSGPAPVAESNGEVNGDKIKSFNHGLALAKRLNKPVAYGYSTGKFGGTFVAFDKPFKYDLDDTKFRKQYGANVIYVAYPDKSFIDEEYDIKKLPKGRRYPKSIIRNMLKDGSLDDPEYVGKLDSSEFEDLVDTWSFQYYDGDNVNLYSDLNNNKEYCIIKDGDNIDVEFEEDAAIRVAKELDADKVLLVKYKGIDKNGDYYGEETWTVWEAGDEMEEDINKNFKLTHI